MRNTFLVGLGLGLVLVGAHKAGAQPDGALEVVPVGPVTEVPVGQPIPEEAPRQGAPEVLLAEDVREFFQQLNTTEGQTLSFEFIQAYVKGARTGYFGANEWAKWWPNFRGALVKLDDLKIESIGDGKAVVVLKYTRVAKEDAQSGEEKLAMAWGKAPNHTLPLWQFVPEVPEKDDWFYKSPLRWSIYVLGQQPGSWERFSAALSMSNLKQLGLGAFQSLQDYEQRFAYAPEFVEEALQPYLHNDRLWVIPGTKEHYSFNGKLSERTLGSLADPAHTVLFYEGQGEKPVFRYGGKAVIGYADGHVGLVDAEEFEDVKWR